MGERSQMGVRVGSRNNVVEPIFVSFVGQKRWKTTLSLKLLRKEVETRLGLAEGTLVDRKDEVKNAAQAFVAQANQACDFDCDSLSMTGPFS